MYRVVGTRWILSIFHVYVNSFKMLQVAFDYHFEEHITSRANRHSRVGTPSDELMKM
jgi:hypothetical protein